MQAYHLVGDEEVCRDFVADCFECAWDRFDNMPIQNMQAYVRQTLKNRCIDYLRHQEVEGKYIELYKHMASVAYDSEAEELMERIYSTIDQMTPPTGLILEEVFVRKKRYKEVADEMGISTGTVKKHVCKALKMLREKFTNIK